MRDPYQCLAVPRTASAEEINKSFRQLAKQLHPDVNNDPKAAARFIELNVAHDILSDNEKRRAFDRREIDAEGKPALAPGRARSGMWHGVTLTIAVFLLSALSTVMIQRIRHSLEMRAPSDGDVALSRPRNKDRADTPDGAQSELRIILQQNDSYATDNIIPLGLQVGGQTLGMALDISGLPSGTTLSSGQPIGGGKWRILAADVGNAMVCPPRGFRAALDFVAELRLADESIVDSGSFRLEWTSVLPTGPVRAARDRGIVPHRHATTKLLPKEQNPHQRAAELDREQIEFLVGRSQVMMSQGDFVAARTLLRRAAEKHDARAALALGATFDPIMMAIIQAPGVASDISSARYWYKKASEFGSLEAQQRLQLLAFAGVNGGRIAVDRVTVSRRVEAELGAKAATSGRATLRTDFAPSHEPASLLSHNDPSGVYVGGDRVGADPDRNIRAQLLRDDASRQLRTDRGGRQL
jgi:DnaJ domain